LTHQRKGNLTDLSNETSFEEVFRTHYGELVSFANRYVHTQEIAEELVQDVFMTLWSNAARVSIQTSVRSYLFGAVRNAALNHIKHEQVSRKYVERQLHATNNHTSTDFLELDELHEKIQLALAKIPAKCREIFELNRFEGKRYKEIAEQLNLSLKTVENQMGKALKILREELGEYLPLLLLIIGLHGGNF